jgi:hypothetical protein
MSTGRRRNCYGDRSRVGIAAPRRLMDLSGFRGFLEVVVSQSWDAQVMPRNNRRANMPPLPPTQDRVERRDRALALRRKIKAVAGAVGVAGVGLVGYVVAVGTPTKTAIPAVSAVRTVTAVITVGDDGVVSKTTTTTLAPGTATAGTAASAVTVTGGSTVVKKP